ncbi:MAG TPA: hypothetical protein VGV67_06445, partial [Solirubrobacteraceae bacterium]|nr:hypothetical protein [Solirubrobacteraceae bacterium]
YITPIHLPKTRIRRGRSASIFGMLRPAAPAARVRVQIQFRQRGAKRWRTRKRITVGGPRHYFNTSLRVTRAGSVRILWSNGGRAVASRAVSVVVTR